MASCVVWIFSLMYLNVCAVDLTDLSSILSCQQTYGHTLQQRLYKHTLLTKAAEEGQSALVEKLLLAGANIEATDQVVNLKYDMADYNGCGDLTNDLSVRFVFSCMTRIIFFIT